MDTNINYTIFEGDEFPVDESLLNNISEEYVHLAREMMASGHYQDGLDISKFLDADLTINMSKLDLAIVLSVIMLENNSEEDVTLKIINLPKYYELRAVDKDEKQMREERVFLMSFISATAMEASRNDTLVVKFL